MQMKYDVLKKINEEHFSTPKMPDEYPFWLCEYGHTHADMYYHEATFNTAVTRIEYVISGKGIINSKNYSCVVEAGDTYILHEGDNHNYYSDTKNPMDKIWFNLKGVLAKEVIKIYKLDDVILFKGIDSTPFITQIHEICKSTQDPYVIQAKTSAVFCELINFLARQYKMSQNNEDFLDDIRSYIDLHVQDDISIDDLCHISNKSVNQTIRLFKNRFGITPHQYIMNLKLCFARTLLRSSDMSVEKIAEKIHFCGAGYFSDVFYKNTGMRPSEYRKKFRNAIKYPEQINMP